MGENGESKDEFYFDYIRLLVENRMLQRSGYYLGASNQFVRLFTLTARRYWLAQATSEHLTADWKIHFSIRPRDIPVAFNLLSELYFDMKMPIGLKARYPDHWKDYENQWPEKMRGREITVYILLYEKTNSTKRTMSYSGDDQWTRKGLIDVQLSRSNDIYADHDLTEKDQISIDRYLDYAVRAEKLLEENHIQSNGCADGDFPIGKYTSLRNEKFVAIENNSNSLSDTPKLIYPPNECGYNGAGDKQDLAQEIISLNVYIERKKRTRWITASCFVCFCIGCIGLITIYFFKS